MGLFSSSKSTTNVSNEFITDSYNRDYATNLQALTGLGTTGDYNTLSNLRLTGQENVSGLALGNAEVGAQQVGLYQTQGVTLGYAGASQIGFSAAQAKIATGAVGADFNYAESGAIMQSAILNKTSGGGAMDFGTGGSSSGGGGISNWVIYAALGIAAFWLWLRRK